MNIFDKTGIRLLALLVLLLISAGNLLAEEPFVAVVATDYTTGKLATLGSSSPWPGSCDLSSVCSDAVARYHDGLIYIVNRLGCDNIQVIDPNDDFATLLEFSVGGGSNPQGIVFSPDGSRAYVSRQNSNDVLIVDPTNGDHLGNIDLSSWNDADGSCEPGDLIRVGDLIYVAILRVDRDFYWSPVGDSYLAVIETNSDTLLDLNTDTPGIQAIPLTGTNPAWEIQQGPDGMIYTTCVGFYGLMDGGLDRVDPNSFASLGFAVTEAALGGDIGDVVFVDEELAYCVVSDASFNTHIKTFDPSSGGAVTLFEAGAGFIFFDMERDVTGELYVADQSFAASGVRVYDAASGALLAAPISTCLPPYDILVPGGAALGVDEQTPTMLANLSAWPNPFNPRTTLVWRGLGSGDARLSLFDAAGRRVSDRRIGEQEGNGSFVWNGLDERGAGLPSGVYLARISVGEQSAVARLILLR